MYKLGVRYDQGHGVEKNKSEAFHWYERAAEQCHADAQFNLGVAYDDGEGIKVNKAKAFK
jgi:TPR repeat protein